MLTLITTSVMLSKQGKLEDAIKAYKKAISLKPDYAEAYTNLFTLKKA